jgi:hypothetical protein
MNRSPLKFSEVQRSVELIHTIDALKSDESVKKTETVTPRSLPLKKNKIKGENEKKPRLRRDFQCDYVICWIYIWILRIHGRFLLVEISHANILLA